MARFIHSILEPAGLIAADGEEIIDLPVNPLSVVYIHISPLNETADLSHYGALNKLVASLENIRIDYRGASVVDISGTDLVALLSMSQIAGVRQSNQVNTNDERRSLVIPVPLGRKLYDPKECFPETKKGEMQLHLTWDIADVGYDALIRSVETVELPEANPVHFQRLTTLAVTFIAIGINDLDLPIGQLLRGVLCFGTTPFAGAVPAPSLGALRLLLDNIESHYAATDFEVSRAVSAALGHQADWYLQHVHQVAAAPGDSTEQETFEEKHDNYTYLDLDPTRDDMYAVETKGRGRVHLRLNLETADLCRFIPVEKVAITEFLR